MRVWHRVLLVCEVRMRQLRVLLRGIDAEIRCCLSVTLLPIANEIHISNRILSCFFFQQIFWLTSGYRFCCQNFPFRRASGKFSWQEVQWRPLVLLHSHVFPLLHAVCQVDLGLVCIVPDSFLAETCCFLRAHSFFKKGGRVRGIHINYRVEFPDPPSDKGAEKSDPLLQLF